MLVQLNILNFFKMCEQFNQYKNPLEKRFVLLKYWFYRSLDAALLRRFEKRILLALPSEQPRVDLFKYFFRCHPNDLKEDDFRLAARMTDHYSGSDIKLVCKEAIMARVREKLSQLINKRGEWSAPYLSFVFLFAN